MTTGWVCHERYFWHDEGSAAAYIPAGGFVEPDMHIDNPGAKRRFRNLVEVSGMLDHLHQIKPRLATNEELRLFHTQEYIDKVKIFSVGRGGDVGDNAIVGPDSYEIASLAVGGCIEAVNAVLNNQVQNAYALIRPAGHHAESDRGRGYCIFGNVALAVLYARIIRGIKRVAVVDWDVHHGNGTQSAFYSDETVLTISVHQDRLFPHDQGFTAEIGEGNGRGYNINIPFPPGTGSGAYHAAFERIILPALELFQPELIVVACGFDANAIDPLGRQLLYSDSFRFFTKNVKKAAEELCDGRLFLCQEGGYSTAYVPFCGLAVLEELTEIHTEVSDPILIARRGTFPFKEIQPQQDKVIEQVEKNLNLLRAR
jgi:acetoin utilization deacetylase AcuC-like enzyme